MKLALRYRLDRKIRATVMSLMGRLTRKSPEQAVDLKSETVKKILLVRGIFRLGDLILATPAILLLRDNFPDASIDFAGPAIAKALFQNLPIGRHYEACQRFPKVCWSYLAMFKQIRAVKYDLAVDVSGSSAALGSIIVGFSAARFRVGLKGKWDRWFNIRLCRPATINKYRNLPELVAAMGLATQPTYPTLVLSSREREQGRKRLQMLICPNEAPLVGVFVGGRKARGKRWARENFVRVATGLRTEGMRPILFVGPEERSLLTYYREALRHRVPVVLEPDARTFASLVANCDLFVACDSGPVHLACALRVRTIVIFLRDNFDRWGPPPVLARIVYDKEAVLPDAVLEACRQELTVTSPVEADIFAVDHGPHRERA